MIIGIFFVFILFKHLNNLLKERHRSALEVEENQAFFVFMTKATVMVYSTGRCGCKHVNSSRKPPKSRTAEAFSFHTQSPTLSLLQHRESLINAHSGFMQEFQACFNPCTATYRGKHISLTIKGSCLTHVCICGCAHVCMCVCSCSGVAQVLCHMYIYPN